MIIIHQFDTINKLWSELVEEFNIKNNRERYNVIHRHAFAVACLDNTILSMTKIAKILGRNHATIIHSRKNHKWNVLYDKTYARFFHLFCSKITECCAESDEMLDEVIRSRAVALNNDDLISHLEMIYERKAKRLEQNYMSELELLRHTNKAIVKALKTSEERVQRLNNECLRLKSLML